MLRQPKNHFGEPALSPSGYRKLAHPIFYFPHSLMSAGLLTNVMPANSDEMGLPVLKAS